MKKLAKIINITLLFIILLTTILPVICNLSIVLAADASIEYHGKIKYGYSTVGDFTVNGVQAFCIDHVKPTPPTGTEVNKEILENESMAKCLYYGWGGAEQWDGFTSREMGIVVTSLALDYFNNGNNYSDCRDFVNYIKSVDLPDIILDFTNKNLTAYATENNMQRTDSTSVTGSSEYYLTINLQDGVTLVNETKGTEETGNVNVYGGDTFYLKAPLTVNGSWTSNNIDNCKYQFQPIVYRTLNTSLQDLSGGIYSKVDPSTTTNLSANWLNTGVITVHKIDADTGDNIPNTTFALKDNSGNITASSTTNSSGIATFNDVKLGLTYKLVETEANSNYVLNTTENEITMSSTNEYIELKNQYKRGNLVIHKVDSKDNTIVIPNTVFDVFDDNNNLISTITTNSKGIARLDNIKIR